MLDVKEELAVEDIKGLMLSLMVKICVRRGLKNKIGMMSKEINGYNQYIWKQSPSLHILKKKVFFWKLWAILWHFLCYDGI